MEAQIFEVIRDLKEASRPLVVKEIASWLQDRHGEDYERKITPKWVGSVLRKKLHLHTSRSKDGYAILPEELVKLPGLYERYGVEEVNPSRALGAEGAASLG